MLEWNFRGLARCLIALVTALSISVFIHPNSASAASKIGAQSIVDASVNAMRYFRDTGERDTIDALLRSSKAVMIFPGVGKAGFILVGEAGTGVMLKQDGRDDWSDPAFFRMVSGSVGFQAGVSETRILLIIMTDKALETFIEGGGKVGVDVSAAAITVGVDAELSTTATRSDVYYFAQTKSGLFAGVSLEGSGIAVRDTLNQIYYDAAETPRQIVGRQSLKPGAAILRGELAAAAAKK